MKQASKRLLFFGRDDGVGLCPSYIRSANALGHEVKLFQYDKHVQRRSRFEFLLKRIERLLPQDSLIQSMNRKFLVLAKEWKPDVVLSVTNAPIRPSSLLFLRSILPNTRFVLIWPDSLANMQQHVFSGAPLYDFVASYGRDTEAAFLRAGFRKVRFVPLAGDPRIHWMDIGQEFDWDISFVGGWRPEREAALSFLRNKFPGHRMRVIGPKWPTVCRDRSLRSVCSGQPLFGKEMASLFQRTRVNINVIDDTNFPSANMRFFEIPTAGGVQVSSPCPDMDGEFLDGRHLMYYNSMEQLAEKVELLLKDPVLCDNMRHASQELIASKHNYDSRLHSILKYVEDLDDEA